MTAVARPYPALTIAAVLGAPAADAPRLQEWSNLVQRQFDIRALQDRAWAGGGQLRHREPPVALGVIPGPRDRRPGAHAMLGPG